MNIVSYRTLQRIGLPNRSPGAALLAAGLSCLLLVATWGGQQYAWTSAQIVGLGIAAVVLLVAFVAQERRAAEPILS